MIGFSSFGVLLYYSIANISAMTLTKEQKRPFLLVPIVGLVGCLALAVSVPWQSLVAGLVVTLVGLAIYGVQTAARRGTLWQSPTSANTRVPRSDPSEA